MVDLIIMEIRRECDSQYLDQLVDLMIKLNAVDLLEACSFVEKILDSCQLIAGIFEGERLLGVAIAQQNKQQTSWLISPLMIFPNYQLPKEAGQKLLKFVKREVRYLNGNKIKLSENECFLESIH